MLSEVAKLISQLTCGIVPDGLWFVGDKVDLLTHGVSHWGL